MRWYPPPANSGIAILPGLILHSLASGPPCAPLPAHIKSLAPLVFLVDFLLLPSPACLRVTTDPYRTTPGLDTAKAITIMDQLQAQPNKQGFSQPQITPDVVAAVDSIALHALLQALNPHNQHEGRQRTHGNGLQEELPPYDSVSVQTFVADLENVLCCDCSNLIQRRRKEASCRATTVPLTLAIYNDFVLFASQFGCPSDQESSIVSCFTDDLSHITRLTESLSGESSMNSSIQSQETSNNAMLRGCSQKRHPVGTRPINDVADWLDRVDPDIDCMQLEDTFLQERPTLDENGPAEGVNVEKSMA